MQRITDATAVGSLPAVPDLSGLTPGYFTGGNPASGQAATRVRAWWLNMMQEEWMAILTAAGIAPSATNNGQILQALQALFEPAGGGGGGGGGATDGIYRVTDTGSENAIEIAPSPAITPTNRDMCLIQLGHDITGACSIDANGTGFKPLVTAAGDDTQGGEGVAGGFILVAYRQAITSWVLLATSEGSVPVSEPTESHHAATKQYVDDSIDAALTGSAGFQAYSSAGSHTFTIPAGVTAVEFETIGGGGGSGGGTSSGSRAGAGGGGALVMGRLTGLTPGGTLAIVVGAGGTAGSVGGAGGDGGDTTIEATTVVAEGGTAGSGQTGSGFGTNGSGGAGTGPSGSLAFSGVPGKALTSGNIGGFTKTRGSYAPIGDMNDAAVGIAGATPGQGASGAIGNRAGATGHAGLVILRW